MSIIEAPLQDIEKTILELGFPKFHAKSLCDFIFKKGVMDFDKMSSMPKALREKLKESMTVFPLKLVKVEDSSDNETKKFLFEMKDGALVESVLIASFERRTVCVSSQVGCPAKCAFCASGKEGLIRNLSRHEIEAQVAFIQCYLLERQEPQVSQIVFMGMGEPLNNFEEVIAAIDLIKSKDRLEISERRITVSTVGIVDKIIKVAEMQRQFHLVLSLHAPNQHIRKKIIPFARKYELSSILEAMLYFASKTKRQITYEYTLLAGINDSLDNAKELASLVAKHPCTVNLIPYNPVVGLRLKRPEKDTIEAFRDYLKSEKINVTWRYTKGKDIAAACGQLALQEKNKLLVVSEC
jgi:23S rRNA (adenine2503-C2)-methyltransferase